MYDQGMVPTARVAPLLRRHLEEDDGPGSEAHGSLPRILHKWETEQEWAEFTSVDRIFCQISDAPLMLWMEIQDVYYRCAVDASPSRSKLCQRRGCSNKVVVRAHGYNKRYCSRNCQKAQAENRRRAKEGRPQRANRYDTCARGHDRSEENVYIDKVGKIHCRPCRRKMRLKREQDPVVAQRRRDLQNARRARLRSTSRMAA